MYVFRTELHAELTANRNNSKTTNDTETTTSEPTPARSMSSSLPPTNYVTGQPTKNTLRLSNDVISQCITARSSLNLTAQDEITISYIQNMNPRSSGNLDKLSAQNATVTPLSQKYERGSPPSEHAAQVGSSQSQQRGRPRPRPVSPDSATGLCSVFVDARPDSVISVLFLSQTCSHDNQVHVRDLHDGWSTTLDGCSPWKPPGYDVTTVNRSAVVVIDLRSLADAFQLKVQIKAAILNYADGVITRYVSPVLGYVQNHNWHPYARSFAGNVDTSVTVLVPSNHATLISAAYLHLDYNSDIFLYTVDKGGDARRWEWEVYVTEFPDDVLRTGLVKFSVLLGFIPGYFFHGTRVLFSFHRPSLTPQRNPDGLWNCSVPFWTDFYHHFVCNNKMECAGREDEMWCPDTSCDQDGMLIRETCYIYLRLPEERKTWNHASYACKQRGAALASFTTVLSWYDLGLILHGKTEIDYYIYIGLKYPDSSYPYMYRYSLQWYGGSIAHYVHFVGWIQPQSCVYINVSPNAGYCAAKYPGPTYALCQKTPPYVGNVSQDAQPPAMNVPHKAQQSFLTNASGDLFPFPTVLCPNRHRTLDFLACDAFSACWHGDYDARTNDASVVVTDNAETTACVDGDKTSFAALFPCQNSASSVPYSLVCNRLQDCVDNSDEDFCVFPPCSSALQFTCANGQCLQLHQHCDKIVQCADESDEADCVQNGVAESVVRTRPPVVADFNGQGKMVYTPLPPSRGTGAVVCPDTHVLCPGDGYCLPVYIRCNGLFDCPGHEDEDGCDTYTCPGLYRCRGLLRICLHPDHLCDGWPQCAQHDDELFCNLTCPVDCACLGHAFTCTGDFHVELFSHLRYLDASGIGLEPGRLVNNQMLVRLSLANSNLTHLGNVTMPNLLSLDLSDNRFSVVTAAELNLLKNLQTLSLARNPLSTLFSGNCSSGFLVHERILHVDLTGVKLKVLDVPKYLPFPNLLSLNMSKSGVTHLMGDGFQSLTSLRILDLHGCPMTEFPRRALKNLNDLHLVFVDNYKLCCEVCLPAGFNVDNCRAPFNEISSCDALLRADVYRICLSVLAALALCGNLGCFTLRIFSLAGRGKTGFNVFVTHLCVSDFVMGVYMATIGVADRLYLRRYVSEDGRWRNSAACKVAGVLALLSSEVSALIICLITLDRLLVIRFPFSQYRFSSSSAHVASFLVWTVGAVLVTLPLLPVMAYKQFYGQTGICVPLPITRSDFDGHLYAFGVMILLNLIIFLIIAVGQISVYLSMTSNTMSFMDVSRKSRDFIVARRLITVVLSDFLCWFPLGVLGVLAAQGVPVPGEVNVAMAIFVLPLNSALNPFLYTLNIIQEKRRRATEAKLLKMIMDRGINDNENIDKV